MTILFIKSLLTSLYQSEDLYPSLAKRGKGRFSDLCKFNFETLNNLNDNRRLCRHCEEWSDAAIPAFARSLILKTAVHLPLRHRDTEKTMGC
jgi:hypothetical protein